MITFFQDKTGFHEERKVKWQKKRFKIKGVNANEKIKVKAWYIFQTKDFCL